MSSFRTIFGAIYDKLIVAVAVLVVLLPISPLNVPVPVRDSGVFLYTGWRMLHGQIPYLELWDHKPPVIFFINALGLLIADGSVWGVWFLELISLFLAALIGYTLIKRYLSPLPAFFGLALWLMSLVFIINKGNLTTEYTLLIQFALLWLAVNAEEKGYFSWRGYLIGLLAAVAFFTKQNVIAIPLAILIYLTVTRLWTRRYKELLRALLAILLGSLTITAGLLLYFVFTGALKEFWDAAFAFNFVYIHNTAFNRFEGTLRGIRLLGKTGLAQLALIGWVAALTLLFFRKKIDPQLLAPLAISLLALPLELILVGISGRGYEHYFMVLLPIFAVFASLTFSFVLNRVEALSGSRRAAAFFTIATIAILLFTPLDDYYRASQTYRSEADILITQRIRELTAEDDTVLFWGNATNFNFSTRRVSPSRFNYQIPLYLEGYTDQQKIEEFLAGLIQARPKLLVDTHNQNAPLYQFPLTSPRIEESIAILRRHYQPLEDIGAWTVYEYVENP